MANRPRPSARPADPPAETRPPDSRRRLLAAAAAEFAARGYDAASVDRIARAARLNKAMIYYHFASKVAVYRAIVHDLLAAVLERVRAVAESREPPEVKLVHFIRVVVAEAQARPAFAPLFLREVAEGGRHLDRATLDLLRRVPETLGAIVAEGRAAGVFRPRHPLLLHFGIVGPLALFVATAPLRQRLQRAGLTPLAAIDPSELLAHLEETALAALAVDGDRRGEASRRSLPLDPESRSTSRRVTRG